MLMKIVILDGFTANPGDLSWKPLEEIGEVTVYDRTPPSETVSRAADAEVIVTNKVIISKDVMQQLPKLKYVGVAATGYNVVDLKYASERNIVVTNIPAYSTASVAQMAVAHLLNVTNRVALHAESVSNGEWQSNKDFCYWLTPQRELAGETFGIIGLGNTGLATARIVLALGMKVLALTSKAQEVLPEGITKAKDIDDLFADDDPPAPAPAAKPEAPSPETAVSFSANARSNDLLHEIDMFRAGVQRRLREGNACFFGSRYARVEVPPGLVKKLLDVLPDAMREADDGVDLESRIRARGIVFLNRTICTELIENRPD